MKDNMIVIDLTNGPTIDEIVAQYEAQCDKLKPYPWYKRMAKRIKSWF